METYSVRAVLSAVDSNFLSTMKIASSSLSGIETASESAKSSIMKIASGIGVFKALNASVSLVKGSISSAMGRQDTMEAFNRTITQITGSVENANKALDELRGITKGTAYGLDVAAKATQNFVTRGMDLSKATQSVKVWADAVSFYGKGTNEQLETVTDALAKMRTKGTVEMEQLNRLFDVGINAVGIYAKAVGRDAAAVQDDLSAKTITTQQFLDVVEKAMAEGVNGVDNVTGAALQAGSSWTGTIDNMKAAVTRGTLSVMQAIDNMLSRNKLPQMREMISQFGKGAETTMNQIAAGIENLKDVGALIPQIGALGSALFVVGGSVDYINALGTGFNGLTAKTLVFGNVMSSLPNKAKAGINGIVKGFNSAGGSIGKSLKQIAEENNTTVNELKSQVMKTAETYKAAGMDMSSAMKKAYEDIGYVATTKSNEVGIRLKELSDKFANLIPSSVKNKVSSALNSIKIVSSSTSRFIGDSFSKVSDKIPSKFKMMGSAIGKGMKTGTNVGMKAMSQMAVGLSKVFSIAMKSVGPAAILGLVIAGLGIVNNQFGNEIQSMINMVTQKGPSIIGNFTASIISQLPEMARSGSQLLYSLILGISTMLPQVLQSGLDILSSLVEGINQNKGLIVKSALLLVGTLASGIVQAVPQLLDTGLQFVLSITQGILNNMPLIIVGIQQLVQNIQVAITTYLPSMVDSGVQILQNIATGIVQALPSIIVGAIQIMTTLIDTISSKLPSVLNGAVEIVGTLADGIVNNLPQIVSVIAQLIITIVKSIATNLPQILNSGVQIIAKLASGLIQAIPQIITSVGKVAKQIIKAFKETNWLDVGINIIKGIAKGISSAAGQLWSAASKVLGSFKDKVLGFFGIHSPSRWGSWVGRMLDTGVAKGIKGKARLIANQAKMMFDTVSSYVSDISNLGMQYSFAGEMGSITVDHYVDYNDSYINSNGGDTDKNEYYFNITNEMDGKEVSKATYKYDQENTKKDEKFLKKLRGDK